MEISIFLFHHIFWRVHCWASPRLPENPNGTPSMMAKTDKIRIPTFQALSDIYVLQTPREPSTVFLSANWDQWREASRELWLWNLNQGTYLWRSEQFFMAVFRGGWLYQWASGQGRFYQFFPIIIISLPACESTDHRHHRLEQIVTNLVLDPEK